MSGEKCSRWLNGYARWLLALVTALGAVAAFAWASQAEQNERLRNHDVTIAVTQERLKSMDKKLDQIHALLLEPRKDKRR